VLEVKSGEGGVWHVRLAEGSNDVWSDGAPTPDPVPEPAASEEPPPEVAEPGPEPAASPGFGRVAFVAIGLGVAALFGLLAWLAR
jgi:hypothetical protein